MIYHFDQIFTDEQVALIDPKRLPQAQVAVALAPVLCTDCGEYFPLGWVAMVGAPMCPRVDRRNYPHRASNEVIDQVSDQVANRYATDPTGTEVQA